MNPGPPDDLQFQKAEFPDGRRQDAEAREELSGTRDYFGRAMIYGLGAAVAGAILFAIVSLTGYRFSLISILVGYMVGKAIKRATEGRGGLKYQVLAVLLTYAALTTSYIPAMIHAPATRPDAILLVGIALIAPILFVLHDPARGLLNALILFFGLVQAWRQARGR